MRNKLSNQFFSSYVVVFILTILATVLAFVLLSFASGLIEGSLAKNRYPASAIIKEDYTQIDSTEVVQNGGGIQIVSKDYRVLFSSGLDTIGKSQLNTEEFTTFLIESKSKPYHYDILYQPKGEFWLIVTFPTSIRLDFSVAYNSTASADDFKQVIGVFTVVGFVYLLILAFFTFVYARITAAGITVPLRKLSDGTRLLREGDYSARVDLRLKNEFAELQSTFNEMAARIEHEMALRKKLEGDRRQLILDISHDLKNPLSSIQGYADLCRNKRDISECQREEYLQVIQQNSQRANHLLSELFELSRMDSPEFSMELKETDLCEYLRQICGELVPQFDRAGFEYDFDIPEENIFALVDINRFNRIFQNLADNAVQYNVHGTLISVSLTHKNAQAVICFADDGQGIPSHLVEDIFKPFVRVDDSRNSKTGGSGLGLSIAKKIAQAHNGDLILRADQDKGSTFILTIPTI